MITQQCLEQAMFAASESYSMLSYFLRQRKEEETEKVENTEAMQEPESEMPAITEAPTEYTFSMM